MLTGQAKNFTLGADLKDPERGEMRKQKLAQRRISLRLGPEMCEAWEKVDAITIMAIEGWCVGGGAALAVACDLRVMAKSATVYVPEVARGHEHELGLDPAHDGAGGTCARQAAGSAVREGRCGDGAVVGTGGCVGGGWTRRLPRAMEFAKAAAALPPTALKMVKHDVNIAALALSRATAHRDLEAFALMERSEDFAEGVSSFLEGRDPKFTGD